MELRYGFEYCIDGMFVMEILGVVYTTIDDIFYPFIHELESGEYEAVLESHATGPSVVGGGFKTLEEALDVFRLGMLNSVAAEIQP